MAAGAVFLIALVLRLVYLGQIDSIPYYQFPIMDARAYDQWAQEIAAGDWLGKQAFYQAPAYPYLLGVIYWVFGHDLDIAHTVMMGIGAAGCALLFLATRVLFGFAAAVAAGAFIALYPPAIFFDGLIGKASLGLLLISGMLLLLLIAQVRPGLARFTAAGAVLGLLALTREHALVFAPAIPLWIVWRFGYVGGHARAALSWAGAFLLGAALVLGPVALRNYVVGDTFALTTSQLGPNFFIGNNPEATGFYESLIPGRHTPDFESPDATRLAEHALGRSLTRGEVSDYWLGRGLDFELFKPGQTNVKEYYAELPIAIKLAGKYHDLGAFASDIANLPRIVTLNNLNLAAGKGGALTLDATAKTYRYLDADEVAAQRKAKQAATKGPAK